MKRFLVAALILSMGTPAFADIRESAANEAKRSAQDSSRQGTSNPYFWPAVGLMGGGALLALYGFTHTTGADVSLNVNPGGSATITAEEKKATGVGLVGLGIAGAGAFVYYKGNTKRATPSIQWNARGVTVQHRIAF